jgi:NADH:ubiquinone oxidoreductase subunit 6 (subunit J)
MMFSQFPIAAIAGPGALAPIALPVGLGALAVYWLLPQARPFPRLWGATAAGLALISAGWFLLRCEVFTPETLLFHCFSALAIVAAGLLVTHRNPGRAALSFALVVLSTSGLFLLQAAPFLMAAAIIIYAGAIVVTFLFVIMLSQQEGPSDADQRSREPLLATIGSFVLLAAVLFMIQSSYATTEIDAFALRLDTTVSRLESLNERNQAGQGKPSEEEIAAELRAIASLVGTGTKDDALKFDRFDSWTRQLGAGPAESLDLSDGSAEGALLTRFGHAVLDVWAALAHLWPPPDQTKPPQPADRSTQARQLEVLAAEMRQLNDIVQQIRKETPHVSSFLQPRRKGEAPGDAQQPMISEASGVAADRPFHQVRRDGHGTPQMPAENVRALGRSLFTDYLVAVEIAGTLLLVATVGAIAIAMRRPEKGA